jgi:GNAT superfamily N-acetyltransferase
MIRQFQPIDASSSCSLIRACLKGDISLTHSLCEKLCIRQTPQMLLEQARLFYVSVYESDHRILGIAGLDMNEIRLLYVSPEHQGKGIGRALLDHLIPMAPAALFPDIFVYSSLTAVGFYKACGFIKKGPFSFDIDGDTLPTVFMARPTGF